MENSCMSGSSQNLVRLMCITCSKFTDPVTWQEWQKLASSNGEIFCWTCAKRQHAMHSGWYEEELMLEIEQLLSANPSESIAVLLTTSPNTSVKDALKAERLIHGALADGQEFPILLGNEFWQPGSMSQ
jgi:hypothetical protein